MSSINFDAIKDAGIRKQFVKYASEVPPIPTKFEEWELRDPQKKYSIGNRLLQLKQNLIAEKLNELEKQPDFMSFDKFFPNSKELFDEFLKDQSHAHLPMMDRHKYMAKVFAHKHHVAHPEVYEAGKRIQQEVFEEMFGPKKEIMREMLEMYETDSQKILPYMTGKLGEEAKIEMDYFLHCRIAKKNGVEPFKVPEYVPELPNVIQRKQAIQACENLMKLQKEADEEVEEGKKKSKFPDVNEDWDVHFRQTRGGYFQQYRSDFDDDDDDKEEGEKKESNFDKNYKEIMAHFAKLTEEAIRKRKAEKEAEAAEKKKKLAEIWPKILKWNAEAYEKRHRKPTALDYALFHWEFPDEFGNPRIRRGESGNDSGYRTSQTPSESSSSRTSPRASPNIQFEERCPSNASSSSTSEAYLNGIQNAFGRIPANLDSAIFSPAEASDDGKSTPMAISSPSSDAEFDRDLTPLSYSVNTPLSSIDPTTPSDASTLTPVNYDFIRPSTPEDMTEEQKAEWREQIQLFFSE